MIIDAFMSDAIPVHLLTREAFEEYFYRLAEDGVLLVHISNRIVDLEPIIGKIADEMGVAARIARAGQHPETHLYDFSVWVLLARRQQRIDALSLTLPWQALENSDGGAVWTDDYTNMLPYLMWRPGSRE